MRKTNIKTDGPYLALVLSWVLLCLVPATGLGANAIESTAPESTVKLIFIHHSCGENWLRDGHGNLGRALGRNNYFVSDTNYGWGPDSIGDRTDIVNWPEWFTSSGSNKYIQALLQENSRHSSFNRTLADPGGKNRIIMFKSCFPNSNLGGNPKDPPRRGGGLNVGNAKAIYNELLGFFATRPDILFVAVTAPPVQDSSLAANARAFNNWLVYDWLRDYQGSNVGVFDFYNVLTGPDNHHRVQGDRIEHVVREGANTLFYPTNGDNHPSPAGNRKATQEFVPLLNTFYHNWQQGRQYARPRKIMLPGGKQKTEKKASAAKAQEVAQARPAAAKEVESGIVSDFEADCSEWQIFADQSTAGTSLEYECQSKNRYKGQRGLHVRYNIAPQSWGTCSLVYSAPRSWGKMKGISLQLMAEKAGQKLAFVVYQGNAPDDLHHFEYHVLTTQEMVNKWQKLEIGWDQLKPPPWEGSPETKIDLARIQGVAFAFNADNNAESSGMIWVDEIMLTK